MLSVQASRPPAACLRNMEMVSPPPIGAVPTSVLQIILQHAICEGDPRAVSRHSAIRGVCKAWQVLADGFARLSARLVRERALRRRLGQGGLSKAVINEVVLGLRARGHAGLTADVLVGDDPLDALNAARRYVEVSSAPVPALWSLAMAPRTACLGPVLVRPCHVTLSGRQQWRRARERESSVCTGKVRRHGQLRRGCWFHDRRSVHCDAGKVPHIMCAASWRSGSQHQS